MTKWFKNKYWRWGLLFVSKFFILQAGLVKAVPEVLVQPSPFKGLNGLSFDAKGQLYVGSIAEQTLYKVDVATGKYDIFLKSPEGQADDLIFTPDGQIFYTALLSSEVRTVDIQTNKVVTIAAGIPAVDPIAQDKRGRVFVGQSLSLNNTGLYEVDPTGENPPRLILNKPGLNGFDFGADGLLYSPVQFTGEIIRINVATGAIALVASGLTSPIAVKFNSQGELFALDASTGQVMKVDLTTGQTRAIAQLQPGLDNLAFGPTDLLYASNFVDSDINEVNTKTGFARKVLDSGGLTAPNGISIYRNSLYVADTYSYRILDSKTGRIQQTIRTIATPIQNPLNVSVNDRNAIVSSWFAGTVQRLNRETGAVLNTYTGFGLPYDAIELRDSSIVLADCALNQLTQIVDTAGTNRRILAKGLSCPTGLARVNDSTVLVTEFLSNSLSRIDLTSGQRTVIAEDLSSPEGVAYHADGIAIVAETGTQSVRAININTGKSLTLQQNLPIGSKGFPGGPPPHIFTGLAISGDTIYITGDLDNSIRTLKLDSIIRHKLRRSSRGIVNLKKPIEN